MNIRDLFGIKKRQKIKKINKKNLIIMECHFTHNWKNVQKN